ncbi:MAG TPA: cytochrome c-type biogenesis protein [Alphaproteobacteria bacterium]|nr:cytochrome c-type biogenesis protein [Alphaproteobacteria bacterium]
MLIRAILLLACLLLPLGGASALAVDTPLPDPKQEARAEAIQHQLRCLVCQNQSIAESDADLARDLRMLVRRRIAAGDSDRQVIDYIVARYGDWVLLKPPLKTETALLWGAPALLLVLGGGLLALWYRRRRAASTGGPAPLSAAEQARLDELLKDDA